MGNISIDSRSLRSAHGGPGYAAPVARRMVVEKPEPRAVKVGAENYLKLFVKYLKTATTLTPPPLQKSSLLNQNRNCALYCLTVDS